MNKYKEGDLEVAAKLAEVDLRLNSILTYFSCNRVPSEYRVLAVLDIFRIPIQNENDIRIKLIQSQAQLRFLEIINDPKNTDFYKNYEKYQNDYKEFRSIVAAFINAFNMMENEKYVVK